MIQLLYKTPNCPTGWQTIYAKTILKAFDGLQKTLDKVMKIVTLTNRELNEIVSLGDVVDWQNARIID